jgi:serine/threonine protein kinase
VSDDIIGKTLGQYEVLEEVGRGGMATVYRARQGSINRVVAVKVLPRSLLHDPGFYERFEREVDVIAHLEHPHILPIYDFGNAEGVPYIVMRYLAGGSMRDLIRRGVPPLEDIEKPFSQVAQALDHAHKQGIIHRDLKPGNIMLDENGNAYLTDFGIARVLGSDLTGSAIIGTPAYMSPEQANGFPLDARSDIYALGVVLFELITGREPYQAETPMALLLKHINEPMPPASIFRKDVPPAVEDVISRATAKDPGDRYASSSDMARAYRDALQQPKQTALKSAPKLDDSPTFVPAPDETPAKSQTGTRRGATRVPIAAETSESAAPARSGISPAIIIAAVVGIIALGVIGLVILPNITGGNTPVVDLKATVDAIAALPPTPFSSAQRIEQNQYAISIPREWIPPQGFLDITRDGTLLSHIWQANDLSAYVSVTMVDSKISSDTDFQNALETYVQANYQPRTELTFIDTAAAQDGSIRRSYRLDGPTNPPFPPGQTDVFFMRRGNDLVVAETYSSDSTGNTLVPTFQMILDSLRIKSS